LGLTLETRCKRNLTPAVDMRRSEQPTNREAAAMDAKSRILLAALCLIPAEHAESTVCKQAVLDGDRVRVSNCGDGSCGVYQVGADGMTDLGFGGSLPDVISFEFYSQATGTFNLAIGNDSNYASCTQCILIFQDLDGSLVPQKTFFQTGGSLKIDMNTIPGVAADVGLSWSNLTLAEVTIDPDTFTSTLVPNGDCYTVIPDTVFRNGFETP
jgi:hypothetical protein